MLSFIENQHVARRRPSHLHTVLRHKPESYGADFIRQVKQKPAHSRPFHTRTARAFRPKRSLFALFKFRMPVRSHSAGTVDSGKQAIYGRKPRPFSPRGNSGATRREPGKRERGGAGFSFPLPSFMTLAVIAGTLVISLFALNWEGISLPLPEPGAFAFEPGPDMENRRNLASYAGISSPAALPVLNAPMAETETVEAEQPDGHEIPLDLT
jgi:hypothetical protein